MTRTREQYNLHALAYADVEHVQFTNPHDGAPTETGEDALQEYGIPYDERPTGNWRNATIIPQQPTLEVEFDNGAGVAFYGTDGVAAAAEALSENEYTPTDASHDL